MNEAEPIMLDPLGCPDYATFVAKKLSTQALMNVGDAAVAWLKQREDGTELSARDAERVLVEAARVLAATGW